MMSGYFRSGFRGEEKRRHSQQSRQYKGENSSHRCINPLAPETRMHASLRESVRKIARVSNQTSDFYFRAVAQKQESREQPENFRCICQPSLPGNKTTIAREFSVSTFEWSSALILTRTLPQTVHQKFKSFQSPPRRMKAGISRFSPFSSSSGALKIVGGGTASSTATAAGSAAGAACA